ncbi:hypothetical protein Ddc_22029 [Ditylenchus destructor]|nr:hypothetical protein Ddc_22029 [Ditylenchus destructor]
MATLPSWLSAVSLCSEPICKYEKETQLPEQTEDRAQALDHRPIAKSTNGLISEWHKKPELNPKPGDIIQYGEHQDVALYLGKGVAHIFGDKFKNYDVLIHMMKDDLNDGIHIQLFNWAKEKDTIKARKYNILESKYESFSVIEMAKRAKKWIGCKVTISSYEKYNYKHFAHLIKHGRLESIIENDLKKLYEDNDPR